MTSEQRPDAAQPAQDQTGKEDEHLTRRGEAAGTLPKEETPNASSPVPDEYRRDPSDDGLPDSG
jgi:hypothetical protein